MPLQELMTSHGVLSFYERRVGTHAVVLAHSFHTGYTDERPLIRDLYKAGLSPLSCHLRGLSKHSYEHPSIDTAVADFSALISHAQACYERVSLFGRSMGSIVALRAAEKHPGLHRIAVVSPANDLYTMAQHLQLLGRLDGLHNRVCYYHYDDQTVAVPTQMIDEGICHPEKIQTPTLIIHGCDDEDVPPDEARNLQKRLVQGKLHLAQGGHDLSADIHPVLLDWYQQERSSF